ncbi:hypothetical protein BXY53_1695 [Dichotomicrobium thermohalophilum]|uniref:DUF192 domain-containing protein n=2 Tax=Dichotomicrobium thermohalophilum TaxID=933063 RepID=A0A397Q7X0_9HYPH|nr:hypothetical protein BXY53_1695 [Dichotomicrobium thermohalophilum]
MSDGRPKFAALAVLLGVLMIAVSGVNAAKLRVEPVVLVTETGRHTINAEIADTPGTRATGLMFRRSLDDDAGMLFIYDEPQNITMWMKNTYISLDMIFADASGTIIRIARDTEPFSTDIIEAGGPAKVVLEVAAGTAQRLRLKRGDRLEHPSVSAN